MDLYTLVVSLSNHERSWRLVLRQAQDERYPGASSSGDLVLQPQRCCGHEHDDQNHADREAAEILAKRPPSASCRGAAQPEHVDQQQRAITCAGLIARRLEPVEKRCEALRRLRLRPQAD